MKTMIKTRGKNPSEIRLITPELDSSCEQKAI